MKGRDVDNTHGKASWPHRCERELKQVIFRGFLAADPSGWDWPCKDWVHSSQHDEVIMLFVFFFL